ncbi:MAG TPA: hypothetical protein VEV20_13055 [Burkholderiales bacterium]|nr:hypothetical protein [Burkholderiales bacterium]
MDFDACFVLADENVFGEGRQGAIGEKLLLRSVAGGRKHLDHEHGIFDRDGAQIHVLGTARATHQEIGEIVGMRPFDSHPDIIDERSAGRVAKMALQSSSHGGDDE